MFGALKRGFRSMASLILVRNVVGELRPKRTLAASRGFLAVARLSCTISHRLSGAMEDCSIVRVQQPRTLCRQRCCMSASQRMFGSLWNAAAVHEHRRQRRQSSARYDGEMPDNDWWTNVAALKWTRWRTGSQCS